MSAVQYDYLRKIYPDERENHVIFYEDTHKYVIDGEDNYISVTTFNHSHFEEFDADKIISNMRKGKNWVKSKYYGMTDDEIKKLWDDNRIDASTKGTKMHLDIEGFYNKIDVSNDSIEYGYFKKFHEDHKDITPYRTELIVYDKDLRMSGSVDFIVLNDDGTYDIYDWKRSRNISKTSPGGKFGNKDCIEHIPDSNYWHYSLQLNTYKQIIQKNYNKKIRDMWLVCLHPDNDNKSYKKIKVVDLENEVFDLFQLRIDSLKN